MANDTNCLAGEQEAERIGPQGERAADAGKDSLPVLRRVNLQDHPDALQELLESLPGPVTIEGVGGNQVPKG